MAAPLHRTSEPDQEVITPQQAKDFLREDHPGQDTVISGLITAVREWIEDETALVFGLSSFELFLEGYNDFQFPVSPVDAESISISYKDPSGNWEPLSESDYELISEERPPRVRFKASVPPVLTAKYVIKVEFVAGYSAQSAPKRAITAMKLLMTHYYTNRDPGSGRVNYDEPIPRRLEHFIRPLKLNKFL
jgi:uncharacterized phiE125 gp8 family phage protein